jgi:LysM repeat protein
LLVALAVVVAGALFAALPAQPASANYGQRVHCVRYGETLYGIGYMYGVSAHAIAQANGLWNPNYIRAGQCLVIPSYGHGGWGYGHGAGYDKYDWGYGHGAGYDKYDWGYGHGAGYNKGYDWGYGHGAGYSYKADYKYGGYHHGVYCVKYGDTLSGVASYYGVSTYALSRANGLWNPNYLRAGQCLTIPSW